MADLHLVNENKLKFKKLDDFLFVQTIDDMVFIDTFNVAGLTVLWSWSKVSGGIRRFDNARSAHFGGKTKEFDGCFSLHVILFCVGVEICF